MAKITLSDGAPAEAVHFTFAEDEFDLSGKKSYETDDAGTLAEAITHPWLTVTYPKVKPSDDPDVEPAPTPIAPEDDPMSALGSIDFNDPEVVAAAEAAKAVEAGVPVALDAGLDQTTPVTTGDTAETLAADPTSKTSDKVAN